MSSDAGAALYWKIGTQSINFLGPNPDHIEREVERALHGTYASK